MRYICNLCAKVFQADDITIHYTTDKNGLAIVAICQLCQDDYLEKTNLNNERKNEDSERGKIIRKW